MTTAVGVAAAALVSLGTGPVEPQQSALAASRLVAATPTTCQTPGCWSVSGLGGGGYIPTIAADPSGSGVALAGSDVGGVYRSTNFGAAWQPANTGITVGALSVDSIVFSPAVPNQVYLAVGSRGQAGGVEVSTDDGQTWHLQSTVPQFGGPNPYTAARPSGKLLAVAPDGTLYASTSGQGLLRSEDGGATWTTIGLAQPAGSVPRGVVVSPVNPGIVYVANYGAGNAAYPSGLYQCTNSESANVTCAAVPGAPSDVEDLTFVGSTLYVAASSAGVAAMAPSGLWSTLVAPNGSLWASVAGFRSGSNQPVLYAGAAVPVRRPDGSYTSLLKSTDGGVTWNAVTTSTTLHYTQGGAAGPSWWLSSAAAGQMLGGSSFIPRELAIDPANPSVVIVSGNCDVWGTSDAGSDWYPMVTGLGDTEQRGVVADPNSIGTVYTAGYDWGIEASNDGMANDRAVSPSGVTAAYDLALDTSTTPSTVYLAGFNEFAATTTADVYVNPAPLSGAAWVPLGLAAATGGFPILGVTVHQSPLGPQASQVPVVVAAVGAPPGTTCTVACGIWRKVGTASWVQVSKVAMSKAEGAYHASFSWVSGTGDIYLYDPASGIWRSQDYGADWSLIWAAPSNHDLTAYLAATPNSVYLSAGAAGVWKLTGVATGIQVGNGISAAEVGYFTGAGALTISSDGTVWVAQVAPYGTGLWKSSDAGATWSEVSDSTYLQVASFPTGVSVPGNGQVFVSTKGDGVVTAP